MKIFQEVQKSFNWMGFNPKLAPFNPRILSNFVMRFTSLIFLWIFLIYEAETAQEYMESMYVISTGSGIFLSFLSQIFITKRLFSFIKRVNEAVNESE